MWTFDPYTLSEDAKILAILEVLRGLCIMPTDLLLHPISQKPAMIIWRKGFFWSSALAHFFKDIKAYLIHPGPRPACCSCLRRLTVTPNCTTNCISGTLMPVELADCISHHQNVGSCRNDHGISPIWASSAVTMKCASLQKEETNALGEFRILELQCQVRNMSNFREELFGSNKQILIAASSYALYT